MRHGFKLAVITLLWLPALNIGWYFLSSSGLWAHVTAGNFHSFQRPLTVPLYSPTGKQIACRQWSLGLCKGSVKESAWLRSPYIIALLIYRQARRIFPPMQHLNELGSLRSHVIARLQNKFGAKEVCECEKKSLTRIQTTVHALCRYMYKYITYLYKEICTYPRWATLYNQDLENHRRVFSLPWED